ncbi:MAG TPA: hypothetical protein DIV86_01890, partial [Alphaproteobacteria bacterium]|nr:hypothetical protein [Alphaproteobacteria bacterium]
ALPIYPKLWRFLPKFKDSAVVGGSFIARRLIQCKNSELKEIFTQGYRLVAAEELRNCHRPFTPSSFLEYQFPQPWGDEYFWSSTRFFLETGIGVSGILAGNSPLGLWAVCKNGNTSTRYLGVWNIGTFSDFVNEKGEMTMPSLEMATALIEASQNPEAFKAEGFDETATEARNAGIYCGKELKANEAYLLAYDCQDESELELQKFLINAQGEKLSADDGIAIRSHSKVENDTLVIYFAGGGGCSSCNRLEVTTTQTYNYDVQAAMPEDIKKMFGVSKVQIRLFPEYEGWRTKKYSQSLLDLAKATFNEAVK